ncbi:hypothetical protein [Streptomyces aurantiacus]
MYEKNDPRSALAATATVPRPDNGDAIAAAQSLDLRGDDLDHPMP